MQRITEDTALFGWTERDLAQEAHELTICSIAVDGLMELTGDEDDDELAAKVDSHPAARSASAFQEFKDSIELKIEEAFEQAALASHPNAFSADKVTGGQNVTRVTAVSADGGKQEGALVAIQVWVPWSALPDGFLAA
jgi:hypothetical protein